MLLFEILRSESSDVISINSVQSFISNRKRKLMNVLKLNQI